MVNSDCIVDTDNDGFLTLPERWSRSLALIIANEHGVEELGKKHWQIIDSLREQYKESRVPPTTCIGITRLFPSMLVAWKVAGLPNPGKKAKNYMTKYVDNSVIE